MDWDLGLELVLWIWNFWEHKEIQFRSKLNLVHNALYIHHNFFISGKHGKARGETCQGDPGTRGGLSQGRQ